MHRKWIQLWGSDLNEKKIKHWPNGTDITFKSPRICIFNDIITFLRQTSWRNFASCFQNKMKTKDAMIRQNSNRVRNFCDCLQSVLSTDFEHWTYQSTRILTLLTLFFVIFIMTCECYKWWSVLSLDRMVKGQVSKWFLCQIYKIASCFSLKRLIETRVSLVSHSAVLVSSRNAKIS